MLPLDHRSASHPLALPLLRGAGCVVRDMWRHHLEEPLSWLVWVLGVGGFALRTLTYYHAPTEPPWVGMTIHICVFAIWLLIVREWFALRWRH